MKIAIFGASGMIGQRILAEALERGHDVTAIVRHPDKLDGHEKLTAVAGDVLDPTTVASVVQGHDAVISAISPGRETMPPDVHMLVNTARSLIEGLTNAGVSRLLVVGGAGSLYVAPDLKLFDTPDFPAFIRPLSKSHDEALQLYRASDLDWTFFHPAVVIAPGKRTGTFRLGTDYLLRDDNGDSQISAEDYAIAALDEIENPQHVRGQMTIAY